MASLPAEAWDDDDDFDLSSSTNIALDLPRSEAGSLESGRVQACIDEVADTDSTDLATCTILSRKQSIDDHHDGDIEDWDADIDDDQVDTIKFSDLTSETLAQLASYRKQTSSTLESSELATLSLDNLPGKVTNLGSFAHSKAIIQDGMGEWDDDLEMPEGFPSLLTLRQPSSNITAEIDFEVEEPSFDSTSDATTSGRSTSDARKRGPTQSSLSSKDDRLPRSSSSSSRHSQWEPQPIRVTEIDDGPLSEQATNMESSEIEASFELPETTTHFTLASQTASLPKRSSLSPSSEEQMGNRKGINVRPLKETHMPRYLNATAASRARQAGNQMATGGLAPRMRASSSRILKVPKRVRNYGDGRELDLIADLPIKQEHNHASNQVRMQAPALKPSLMSPAVERANRAKGRKGRRVEPTLIRNLGGPHVAPRTIGNMTWNPALQRWEGNEEEGRRFESAVLQRVDRKAPISRLSSGSTNADSRSRYEGQLRGRSSPIASSSQFAGAKVVGDMIFDPIRLCWLNKNKEDEVDPFSALEEKDEFEFLQSKRLSNRPGKGRAFSSAATSSSHPSSSSSSFQSRSEFKHASKATPWSAASINRVIKGNKPEVVPDSLSQRIPAQLWLDCIAAKTRHDEQVAALIPTREDASRHRGSRYSSNHTPTPERLYKIKMLWRGSMIATISTTTPEHLYLIQTLARRVAKD